MAVYTVYRKIYIYLFICIYAAVSNEKWKPRQFSLIPVPVFSSCKRKFVVCPFVYVEITQLSVCKRTKRTCPPMLVTAMLF